MVDVKTINRDDIGREYVLCQFETRGYFIAIRANKTYSGKKKTQETLDQEAIDIINGLWPLRKTVRRDVELEHLTVHFLDHNDENSPYIFDAARILVNFPGNEFNIDLSKERTELLIEKLTQLLPRFRNL